MNIIDAIHLGLRRGYYQFKQFEDSQDGIESKMTEYILTVFVGIELNENIPGKVKIEYPLWMFYMNAFPRIKWTKKDIFDDTFIIRQYKRKRTKERMDIAIMALDNDSDLRSRHGIEIKAINTNYNDIITDIHRLSGSMITTDKTDTNSIESCYGAFIKSYKKDFSPATSAELENLRKERLKDIEDLLNAQIRNIPEYSNLVFTVHPEDIDSVSVEQYLDSYAGIPPEVAEPEYGEAIEKTYEILSVVIEIKQK